MFPSSLLSLVSRRLWLDAALRLTSSALAQSFLPLLLREQPAFSSVSLTKFLGNNFLGGGGLLLSGSLLLHEHPSLHLCDVILLLCFTTVFTEAVLRLADSTYSITEPNLFL